MENKEVLGKAEAILKKAGNRKICMASRHFDGCSEKIIRAHTISRSKNISKIISPEKKVYVPKASIFKMVDKNALNLVDVGYKEATTFKGFCKTHDSNIFECIDDGDFEINTASFLRYHYRSLCMEVYKKEGNKKAYEKLLTEKVLAGYENTAQINFLKNTEDSLQNLYTELDFVVEELRSSSPSLSFFVLKFSNYILPVLGTGLTFPKLTYHIRQGSFPPRDEYLNVMSYHTIVDKTDSYVLWVWRDDQEGYCEEYIEEIEQKHGTWLNKVLDYTFLHTETFCVKIDWWDSKDRQYKKRIIKRYSESLENPDYIPLNSVVYEDESVDVDIIRGY